MPAEKNRERKQAGGTLNGFPVETGQQNTFRSKRVNSGKLMLRGHSGKVTKTNAKPPKKTNRVPDRNGGPENRVGEEGSINNTWKRILNSERCGEIPQELVVEIRSAPRGGWGGGGGGGPTLWVEEGAKTPRSAKTSVKKHKIQ